MAGEVTRDEFNRLDTRVDVVEREIEGEKLVTRYILEQTRRNGDDLAAIKARLGRVETDVAGLKTDVAGLKTDVAGLGSDMRRLRQDLPGIVGDSMREVLRERDGS